MSLMITSISVTVNMTDAVLTQATNTLQSEIIFHCNAILTDIIEPSSIDIDVKWFVDNKNVHSETFSAQDRVSGVLTEEHWSMGQSIYCEAQAKHNIVGARTVKRRSSEILAGLVVNQGLRSVSVKEGGSVVNIPVTSTVPILCPPQDRARGDCCLYLDLALSEVDQEQRCPQGNVINRVSIFFVKLHVLVSIFKL